MPLPISNGESGLSARSKTNASFVELAAVQGEVSALDTRLDAVEAGAYHVRVIMTAASFKIFCRRQWMWWRQAEGYGTIFVPNTGTVFYVDFSSATNGVGTIADPMNVVPASPTTNATYLLAEGTTWTVSAQRTGAGIGSGTLFGTYERVTGRRLLTEISRLATITWSGYPVAFSGNPTNTGVVFSGVRVNCPDIQQGDRRFWAGGSTATAIAPIFEYVYCDKLDSRLPGNTAVPPGAVFFSFSADTVVRFCTLRNIIADAVWVQAPRPSWYGNDIILAPSDINGPDGLQHSNSGVGMGYSRITANWVEVPTNQKQCLITSGSGYAATDSAHIARNVFWGCDIALPRLGADNQKACEWGAPNALFESNVFFGGQFGLNLSQPANVRGNIFATASGTPADGALVANDLYQGIVLPGSGVSRVTNNTVIRIAGSGGTAISAFAGSHIVSDNVVVGQFQNGIRSGATVAEHDNTSFGQVNPFVTNAYAIKAPGAGSVSTDPMIDYLAHPLTGSPLIGAVSADSRAFVDFSGAPSGFARGALQEAAEA